MAPEQWKTVGRAYGPFSLKFREFHNATHSLYQLYRRLYKCSEPLHHGLPITLRRTVVKIGGSLRLTVPPEIAEILRVKEGDEIEFASTNGDVVIRNAKHGSV